MAHPLHAVTITTPDLDQAVEHYAHLLAYKVRHQGKVSQSQAVSWRADAVAGARTALLDPENGAQGGLVRLIEIPEAAPAQPFQEFGWCGAEFVVQDVEDVAERFRAADLAILMEPKPPWAPLAAAGPNGEGLLFNTPAEGNPFHYDVISANSSVDRISIVVCACADRMRSEAFYAQILGAKPGHRAEMPLPFANTAMGLAPDTQYQTGAMRIKRTPFIELDQYPESTKTKQTPEGTLPSGIALASFIVPSLEDVDASWLAPPCQQEDAFYGDAQSACCLGPDGQLIELIAQN